MSAHEGPEPEVARIYVYRVIGDDGGEVLVGAESCGISSCGALEFEVDMRLVRAFAPGAWTAVIRRVEES